MCAAQRSKTTYGVSLCLWINLKRLCEQPEALKSTLKTRKEIFILKYIANASNLAY